MRDLKIAKYQSIRLIQLALSPGGWLKKIDLLKLLPGATICDVKYNNNVTINNASSQQERKKKLFVFFVGGITLVEVACLRFIKNQKGFPYELIMVTTKVINGNSMLSSLIHDVQNKI